MERMVKMVVMGRMVVTARMAKMARTERMDRGPPPPARGGRRDG